MEDDGDWVYDLYYREPTDLTTLPQGANGIDAGLGPFGDGIMVGALAGLDELLDAEDDPGSDTEEGDEADEDSNGELGPFSQCYSDQLTSYRYVRGELLPERISGRGIPLTFDFARDVHALQHESARRSKPACSQWKGTLEGR